MSFQEVKCKDSGRIIRNGGFYRVSDRQRVQRYKCADCGVNFSQATNSPRFGQNRRDLNNKILQALCSKVSQRRMAILFKASRTTIARKLKFLATQARHKNLLDRYKNKKNLYELQFDDLETFEHSKMKPLSVTMMVEKGSRYILGFEVSKMPAKGHLSKRAVKKYGRRKDERKASRELLLRKLKPHIAEGATFETDENPHYVPSIKKHFPKAKHLTSKGRRGCVVGQGELKSGGFDPLFSLNHTYAMCRDNVNRLVRKTWATTKSIQGLRDHLEVYVFYHNQVLTNKF